MQTAILCIGGLILALNLLYVPWVFKDTRGHLSGNGGYHWLWSPPSKQWNASEIAWKNILLQSSALAVIVIAGLLVAPFFKVGTGPRILFPSKREMAWLAMCAAIISFSISVFVFLIYDEYDYLIGMNQYELTGGNGPAPDSHFVWIFIVLFISTVLILADRDRRRHIIAAGVKPETNGPINQASTASIDNSGNPKSQALAQMAQASQKQSGAEAGKLSYWQKIGIATVTIPAIGTLIKAFLYPNDPDLIVDLVVGFVSGVIAWGAILGMVGLIVSWSNKK